LADDIDGFDKPHKDGDMVEQRFGFIIVRQIDKKTKKMTVQVKTKGEGIPLSEAVVILEGWAKKVKEELQRPYVQNLKFG
jgi:hypothetical protein